MEISGRVLREVEFRDRLRGYDTEEVDEFLEKVAAAVDDLLSQLDTAREAAAHGAENGDTDDTLRRTLVLAQRTADLAIREAREEASAVLEDARAEAEQLVGSAREESSTLRAEAAARARETIADLEDRKTTLETEVAEISSFIEALRKQLVFALQGALETVGESLKPPAPTRSSVRQRLEAVSKVVDEEEQKRSKPRVEDDDLAGPATEAVAAVDADVEGGPASGEGAGAVVEEDSREDEKTTRSRREERPAHRETKAARKEEEPSEAFEGFSITGDEAIVSVESVVDPDEELWQRWAKGAELDTTPEERPRPLRSTGRAEQRGGDVSA